MNSRKLRLHLLHLRFHLREGRLHKGRSSWIEVEATGIISHFWNFEGELYRQAKVLVSLTITTPQHLPWKYCRQHAWSAGSHRRAPQGLRARWKAFKLPDGAVCFVDTETGEAGWSLPGTRLSRTPAIVVSLNFAVA